ncbi:MAG: DUF1822 family protein [Phormidesmis sp.]
MDLTAALKWLNAAVTMGLGHALKEPEIVILKGTWRGLTYEQMANGSEYSTNYLMRDVAPKLWKQLSNIFGRSVGKTNFRVALEAYVVANAPIDSDLATYEQSEFSTEAFLTRGDQTASQTNPQTDYLAGSSATADSQVANASLGWYPSAVLDSATASACDIAALGGAIYGGVPLVASSEMYGYEEALAQGLRWLAEATTGTDGRGRLVGIWGLRGVGKTLLAEMLVARMSSQFDFVVWRSLQSQPKVEDLCTSILTSLGVVSKAGQSTTQLLSVMAQKSLLIVLEDIDSILQPQHLAGEYLPEYRAYGEFLQSASGLRSCLVITGIESPADLIHRSSYGNRLGGRSLNLSHMAEPAAYKLLQAESLASADDWPELIARYQGHPQALKLAARVIREIFNGRVDEFLKQPSVLFPDISRLLSPSFERLTPTETDILYWLASQETPLPLSELQRTLPLPVRSAELISALDSLKQRSLLAIHTGSEPPTFYLPSLVKAYAMQQFISQFGEGTPAMVRAPHLTTYAAEPVINLSAPNRSSQLSQWFQGQFEADWQSLDRLFESAACPATRLRNAYHLRSKTLIKRCKSIDLGAPDDKNTPYEMSRAKAVLLVAVYQESADLYKICVQAQPAQESSVLPEQLNLLLLNKQQVLAAVIAQKDDTFIQLPYLRGAVSESFAIELGLGDRQHTETFVI